MQEAAKMTLINEAEKEVQEKVHTPAEQPRTEPYESLEPIAISPDDCESK